MRKDHPLKDSPGPALALFEPERPHNLGAAMRLAACFGAGLHLIEPAGFPLDDRRIRAGALDYGARVMWRRHITFEEFDSWRLAQGRRLVLLTTGAPLAHHRASFCSSDVLLVGSESNGVPEPVHERADLRVAVPLAPGARSLNLVVAAAVVLAEAMRQCGRFDTIAADG
ncbi:tRNA (cytidine(34)-2'-O)-methyltransferase [Marinimicrococcus flavescens]|uniref:tRNA (cytidine(34)-2'-O)-methyltransferase n=1 Tax=Marinimicrococcus flavescens TaxID=3031815 RepID=A0AAP3UY20_9PROT|nr:TrmH family RNA methyltransferase [Marinimicrococcus flavescens]